MRLGVLCLVLLTGCVASPAPVHLEPGDKVDPKDVAQVADITMATYAEMRSLDSSPAITPQQRTILRTVPVYTIRCVEDAGVGEEVRLAECRSSVVAGRAVWYVALCSFIPYKRHLWRTLPHEIAHKIDWYVRGQTDPEHEDWLLWEVVVPEAMARVAAAGVGGGS